jgi:hypothetical protein
LTTFERAEGHQSGGDFLDRKNEAIQTDALCYGTDQRLRVAEIMPGQGIGAVGCNTLLGNGPRACAWVMGAVEGPGVIIFCFLWLVAALEVPRAAGDAEAMDGGVVGMKGVMR